VAPAKGTFEISGSRGRDDQLKAEERVGTVRSLRDEIPVVAPHGGHVMEWLVEDGDLVSPGQPLVRLHPEAGA